MTDIPEHIVERVAAAINESARMPGYWDAPFTRKEARILARAAIEALGGERVWAVYYHGKLEDVSQHEDVATIKAEAPEIDTVPALLVPLGEE